MSWTESVVVRLDAGQHGQVLFHQQHGARRLHGHLDRNRRHDGLKLQAVRGGTHDDDAHRVALGITHDGAGHVAGLQHMEGHLMLAQVERLGPAPELLEQPALRVDVVGPDGRCHGDAGQARAGPRTQRPRAGLPQRVQRAVADVAMGHGQQDDGHFVDLARRHGARVVLQAGRAQPAPQVPVPGRAAQALAARGDRDLAGIFEVEHEVLGRRISVLGLRLQQAQDHLLQPGRNFGTQASRRHRIHPQTLAQAARRLRVAEGQFAGQHLVEDDADGKQVAARITANAEHLLGRHVGMGADRLARLLGQQIGQLGVVRQPEVQQNGDAAVAPHHVGGLQVLMHDVLPVQAVAGPRQGHAHARRPESTSSRGVWSSSSW